MTASKPRPRLCPETLRWVAAELDDSASYHDGLVNQCTRLSRETASTLSRAEYAVAAMQKVGMARGARALARRLRNLATREERRRG